MNNPLVSILIPVYNRKFLVIETIESALNQTYINTEIIIVDNCSTDNTWHVLQDFSKKDNRIKIFQNAENVGPVLNWKRCIDEASGEYAKILFSDDLISENFIEETLAIFDSETAFVLSKIEKFNKNRRLGLSTFYKKEKISTNEYFEDILFINKYQFPVSPGAAIFRLQELKKSLVVNISNDLSLDFKKYGAGNDLLIFLITAINYKQIKISKKAVSFFRSHDNSFSISNNLLIYYDYSKLYFLNQFKSNWLSKYKTVLWLRNINNKKVNLVYPLIKTKISSIFILKVIFKKSRLKNNLFS